VKALVIDASTTLGFLMHDEQAPHALKAMHAMETGTPVFVPAHWWLEVANGLIMAERRKRATQADITEALHLIQALPVTTDDETDRRSGSETAALARQYGLTIYDAAYLELAMRRGATLATDDRPLSQAATAAGVPLLSEALGSS
jgi:predicted nucleic acid-binding protein